MCESASLTVARPTNPAMNRPYSGLRPVRSILLRCVSIHAAASPLQGFHLLLIGYIAPPVIFPLCQRVRPHDAAIALPGIQALVAANHPDQKTEAKQAQAQQSIANSLSNISATYPEQSERAQGSDKQAEPCNPGDDSRYYDLCAQRKAADAAADSAWWAWAAGIASLVGLIGSVIAGDADAASTAGVDFGRVDAKQADALAIEADRVAVDGD